MNVAPVSPLLSGRSTSSWRRRVGVTTAAGALGILMLMAAMNLARTSDELAVTSSAQTTMIAGGVAVVSNPLPVEARLFSADSPWNQLVQADASYGGVDADGNGVLDDFDRVITGSKATRAGAMTSRQFGIPLAVVDPSQPEQRVIVDCVIPGHIEPVLELALRFAEPPSYPNEGTYGPAKTFGSGPDSALVVMDLSSRRGYDFFQLNPERDANGALVQEGLGTLCEKGGYTTYSLDGPGFGWKAPDDSHADLAGNLRVGIRAAGSAMAAGIMTRSELSRVLAGDEAAVSHALAICLHADQLQRGWVFPAVSEDGYADNYKGSLPMGTRLAIAPNTPRPDEVDTPLGKAIWNSFSKYGGYVVDQCGTGATLGIYADAIVVEPDLNSGVAMYEDGDLLQIAAALRVTSPPNPFAIPAASTPTPTTSASTSSAPTSSASTVPTSTTQVSSP